MRAAVEAAFAPSNGTRRIGLELEMHVRRTTPALTPELVERGRPSFEPGGQLELGLPPQCSVDALLGEVDWCLGEVTRRAEVAFAGVDPWRSLEATPLTRPTPRYLAMQELFDRAGDAGRRMMRLTASLQVCIDLLPGQAGREQWLVANLAGPDLVAAFGGSLERTRIWLGIDPERTAYDGRHLDAHEPIEAYVDFARAAERFAIPEATEDGYHLSTLFPPVRPRGGYLELRYLDSQVPTAGLLDTVWTLMYDERARREALDLLLPTLPRLWERWTTADPADLLSIASGQVVAA
ncbi:MAG TPA: glutamate-cysteine ligase family protein [Nocardioidaceae bacterium]|nr:glutamate-cysteine ligase family protein [Nocardioidaceae bacterium]